jgi:hypothetical protein
MSTRPLFLFTIFTAFVAAVTGFFYSSELFSNNSIQSYSHFVSEIVPSVSIMSRNAISPSRAELTWALQWSFFPIYLGIWLWTGSVWSKEMKQAILKETSETPNIVKRRIGAVLVILVLGSLILTDFGIIDVWSLYRGTLFEGDPSTFPGILRAPFVSNFGMALYAWFLPLAEALCYWMFLLLTVNIREYFNAPQSR